MPVPYPECFCKGKASSGDVAVKKLVSIQVVTFSWMVLGCPRVAPDFLAIGSKLSAKQWSVVKYLHHLCSDGNTPNSVDPAFMGRAAAKMEDNEKAVEALARAVAFFIFHANFPSLILVAMADAEWERLLVDCREQILFLLDH